MRDLDTLFSGVRDQVVPRVTGPEPEQIITRARTRRVRRRAVAGGLAAAVAAGLFFLPGGTGPEAPPVLTPPSPSAPAAPQVRKLKIKDLLYADDAAKAKADGDPQMRWLVEKEGHNYSVIRMCGETDPFETDSPTPFPGTVESRYEITYEGNPEIGSEPTSADRQEQILVFETEDGARATLELIRRDAMACGPKNVLGAPAVGDEAISATWSGSQHFKGVVSRRGRVLVSYGDFRNPDGPELASLDDHERDAGKMVEKLAALGY